MTARNNDLQKRFRCYTKAFRLSPEENEVLNRLIKLSGMTKQDYIIECLINHEVVVYGNPYVYRSLKYEINHFIKAFNRIHVLDDLSLDEIEVLKYMLEIVVALKTKKETYYKNNKESF